MLSELLLILAVSSAPMQAWDGSILGKISSIEFTNAENFAVRVHIGGQTMCTNGPTWAYMNKSHSNYDAILSGILLAHGSSKTVLIHSEKDQNGYCRIGHFTITN